MKKIFTLLFALALVGTLQAQSYKVLNVNQKDGTTQTIKLSDIENLTVTEVGNEEPDTPVTPDNPSETHEYVDLGLPSGTLWATCNVGANSPADYGDYFAWGDTDAIKGDYYDWSTYKWCNGDRESLTKYCTDSNFGVVDNKTILDPEDDAATANWGSEWCMPTAAQMQELQNNCNWTWTTMINSVGQSIQGLEIKSNSNGNTIFFPAAGFWDTDGVCDSSLDPSPDGVYCQVWTSSLDNIDDERGQYSAFCLDAHISVDDGEYYWSDMYEHAARADGLQVRPVRKSTK